jgi:hypothetical protein
MKTMYGLTVDQDGDGYRALIGMALQATREKAESLLAAVRADKRSMEVVSKSDTLAVSEVECYDNGHPVRVIQIEPAKPSVLIEYRKHYGNVAMYPANLNASMFVALTGKKTLSASDVKIIESLGFEVNYRNEELAKSAGN